MLTLNPQYNLTLKAVNHKDGMYVIENCISISGIQVSRHKVDVSFV